MHVRPLLASLALALVAVLPAPASAARHHDNYSGLDQAAHRPAAKVKRKAAHRHLKHKPLHARRKAVQRRHVRGHRYKLARHHRAERLRLRPGTLSVKSRGEMRIGEALAKPVRFIAGRLTCARNVGSALAERGIRGTGSALARSFLGWGHASPPVPGAVAVYGRGRRGGHVAIVAKVVRGTVYVWNPSSRRGWRLMAYGRRAIAYRVAG